jgi:hypothetical protein
MTGSKSPRNTSDTEGRTVKNEFSGGAALRFFANSRLVCV